MYWTIDWDWYEEIVSEHSSKCDLLIDFDEFDICDENHKYDEDLSSIFGGLSSSYRSLSTTVPTPSMVSIMQ